MKKFNIVFSPEELDYILLIMTRETRDTSLLNVHSLAELFPQPVNEDINSKPESVPNDKKEVEVEVKVKKDTEAVPSEPYEEENKEEIEEIEKKVEEVIAKPEMTYKPEVKKPVDTPAVIDSQVVKESQSIKESIQKKDSETIKESIKNKDSEANYEDNFEVEEENQRESKAKSESIPSEVVKSKQSEVAEAKIETEKEKKADVESVAEKKEEVVENNRRSEVVDVVANSEQKKEEEKEIEDDNELADDLKAAIAEDVVESNNNEEEKKQGNYEDEFDPEDNKPKGEANVKKEESTAKPKEEEKKYEEEEDVEPKEQEDNNPKEEEEEDNAKPREEEEKSEHKEEELKEQEAEENADINEDQMIEIAQNSFHIIAEQMLQQKMTIKSLYAKTVKSQVINGEQIEVLSAEDFINGIRALGINDIKTLEYACLIKVLSINDDQKLIKVSDLAQILADYGIQEKEGGSPEVPHKEAKKRGPQLKYEELDQISMVLMLALTEYLIKAKMPLYDLFADVIYQQVVKTKSKQKTVELINSSDFFEVLCKIGIKMEESEHENLKKFLCVDPHYVDRIYVKKLKTAIEEFAFNEELRGIAQNCYKSLIEEEGQDAPEYLPYQLILQF